MRRPRRLRLPLDVLLRETRAAFTLRRAAADHVRLIILDEVERQVLARLRRPRARKAKS